MLAFLENISIDIRKNNREVAIENVRKPRF
jgi:hypothetical protein